MQIKRLRHPIHRFVCRTLPLRGFELARWQDKAAMTFVFDDGCAQDLKKGIKILDEFGVKGVFAPISNLVGESGYLSASELHDIVTRGHEVASHMDWHTALWDRPSLQIQSSLLESQSKLSLMTGKSVNCLVYPYGANTRSIRQDVSEVYGAAFTTWTGLNVGNFNRYAIRRFPFGSFCRPGKNSLESYRDLLRMASKKSAWLVFMLHTNSPAHDDYQTNCLRRIIFEALSSGILISTASEALHRNSGYGMSS